MSLVSEFGLVGEYVFESVLKYSESILFSILKLFVYLVSLVVCLYSEVGEFVLYCIVLCD